MEKEKSFTKQEITAALSKFLNKYEEGNKKILDFRERLKPTPSEFVAYLLLTKQ